MLGVIPVGGPLFSASVIYTIALVLVCIAALLLAKWHDLSRLVAFVATVGVLLFGARSVEQLQFHRPLPPVVYEMPYPDTEATPVMWEPPTWKQDYTVTVPAEISTKPIEGTAVDTDGDGELDAIQPNECKDEGQTDELIQWVDTVLASARPTAPCIHCGAHCNYKQDCECGQRMIDGEGYAVVASHAEKEHSLLERLAGATPHAINCPKPKSCCPCGR